MRRRIGWIALYFAFCAVIGSCNASIVANAPYDCTDGAGHGPSPGTRECDKAIAHDIERRPSEVRKTLLAPIYVGGGLLALYFLLLPISRHPFFSASREGDG